MNKDKISTFTLRIASSNGTGIISILYDIFDEYAAEAIEFFENNEIEEGIECTKKCVEVINHLKKDLNFNYSVAKDLYAIYDYNQRVLARSIYSKNPEGIREIKNHMNSLGSAFDEIARGDSSMPIMRNTQKVVAGYTYGRASLNENMLGNDYNRGFWA